MLKTLRRPLRGAELPCATWNVRDPVTYLVQVRCGIIIEGPADVAGFPGCANGPTINVRGRLTNVRGRLTNVRGRLTNVRGRLNIVRQGRGSIVA